MGKGIGQPIKEHPILFSSAMVKAILEGRKTQTRRVVKEKITYISDGRLFRLRKDDGKFETHGPAYDEIKCPYGKPGDRLWLRETWGQWFEDELGETHPRLIRGTLGIPAEPSRLSWIAWRANGEIPPHPTHGNAVWKSPRFMPRWASRITLEIVSVRVGRLQEITEADAIAEGYQAYERALGPRQLDAHEKALCRIARRLRPGCNTAFPEAHFAALWNAINGKREGCSWDANPYVWVVEFKVITPEVPCHG